MGSAVQDAGEEVTALTAALKIITGKVKSNAVVNKRAFVQKDDDYVGAPNVAADVKALKEPAKKEDARNNMEDDDVDIDLSFLQVSKSRLKIASLVKQAAKVSSAESQQAARKEKVIKILVEKGNKLGSAVLSALAMRVAADPFLKVKKLIQDLIERLVTEAAEEATKKGWCDTELGKAESTRDSNMATIMELNAQLEGLEATKASLEEEIATLTTQIADLNESLTKETKMRADEKAENMDTLEKAKAGLAATKDAYDVLSAFYSKAAKGKVSLLQASSKNEKAPYKGNQD